MTCTEFRTLIRKFLKGTLDAVERDLFVEHERECRSCASYLERRSWDLLDQRGTLEPADRVRKHLSTTTIRRWVEDQLRLEHRFLVADHFDACEKCFGKALTLAKSTVESTSREP